MRAQNELWRGQNRRETSPKELWASDLKVMEVSGAPRRDQESLKEVFKSSKVTIHGVCEVVMSPKEPLAAPKQLPRSFLRAKMTVKVAQKSSTEFFESSESDLKIKNVNVHNTIGK